MYALGAVAYFLLTGTPVFNGSTVMEICMKHVKEPVEPPSVRLGKPVSPAAEALILQCLAKSPAERPKDAAELLHKLETCVIEGTWTASDASVWWASHETSAPPTGSATVQHPADQATTAPDSTMAYDRGCRWNSVDSRATYSPPPFLSFFSHHRRPTSPTSGPSVS